MEIKIREEKLTDYNAVSELIGKAFEQLALSDHQEQFLVQRLRKSAAFVPDLSLVAEYENEIIGYILLTKIKIKKNKNEYQSLALAPVAVLPKYQKQGIGGMLIEKAHKIAKRLGHKSVVLLGHENYYPKFGYARADNFVIKLPFDVPKENCMVIELIENGLDGVNGTVEYPKEFNE